MTALPFWLVKRISNLGSDAWDKPLVDYPIDRPKVVNELDAIGHWEPDTVVGSKDKSKECMLVLTERMTRNELIKQDVLNMSFKISSFDTHRLQVMGLCIVINIPKLLIFLSCNYIKIIHLIE